MLSPVQPLLAAAVLRTEESSFTGYTALPTTLAYRFAILQRMELLTHYQDRLAADS